MLNDFISIFKNYTLPTITLLNLIEITIIIVMLYQIVSGLRNTRAWMITKGIFVLILVYGLSSIFNFSVIKQLFQSAINLCIIAIIILFQGEIKRTLEQLGKRNIKDILFFLNFNNQFVTESYSDETIKEFVDACSVLSEAKTGALIVIEQEALLNDYISTGIDLNADISSQLLINIFEHNTPLHDGAIIIKQNKIAAATCYLPLSDNPKISKTLGTRHRAGIGIGEVSDALVIIVSEETGQISLVKNGQLTHGLSLEKLEILLQKYQNKNVEQDTFKALKKKKNQLTHNLVQKLACIMGGFFIWISIINVQNPTTTATYTIPVSLVNESILNASGKTYEIQSGDTVTVKVSAAKSIIDNLKHSDIIATADFEKLSFTFAVPISVEIPKLSDKSYDISCKDATLQLKLDEIVELESEITLETYGECKDGYHVGSISSNTQTVKITGAKSLINVIDVVKSTLNISNQYKDFSKECPIFIYDRNGNLIDNSKFISINTESVTLNADFLKTKEIPINIKPIEKENSLFKMTSIKPDKKTITIAANEEILDTISELNIKLEINKDSVVENFIATINLDSYLPEGVYIAENSSKLNIEMTFDIYESKTFEIKTSQIEILNLPSNQSCYIRDGVISITLNGLKNSFNNFDINQIGPYLIMDGLTQGDYNLSLKYRNLPPEIKVVNGGVVDFTIKPNT